jgi:hypothetical protein
VRQKREWRRHQAECRGKDEEARGDCRAAQRIGFFARVRILEQRLLDPAIEEHRVDQCEQEIPAPMMAPIDQCPVRFENVGDGAGEACDRQRHQPEDALAAQPEDQRRHQHEAEGGSVAVVRPGSHRPQFTAGGAGRHRQRALIAVDLVSFSVDESCRYSAVRPSVRPG